MRSNPVPALMVGCVLGCVMGCAAARPLDVVPHVDVARYMGRWYEIARYPTSFQKNCHASTADYELRTDGKVDVINRCNERAANGPIREARAVARVADPQSNAKLKVSFLWPFEADYWILELGPGYEWVVVGEPRREYLWILSRSPNLPADTYQRILAGLPAKGYDPERLIVTMHPE